MAPKCRRINGSTHSQGSVGDTVLSRLQVLQSGNQLNPHPENRIKRLAWDNLEVGRLIGLGSFSSVHTVRLKEGQHFNDQVCALKLLKPRTRYDTEAFTTGAVDLLIEAKILASLLHRNIIKLHAVNESGFDDSDSSERGNFFLVLDLLTCTLCSRIESWRHQRCFSFPRMPSSSHTNDRIEKVAIGIAKGMAYLHGQNIIFRDLKPQNIGFDEHDVVKIFDFGIAREYHSNFSNENRRIEGVRHMTGCCGTPRYMAPEVAAMKDYGFGCDVYSFSITLWEICTLKVPFGDVSGMLDFHHEVVQSHKRPPLKSIYSSTLKDLLEQCWDKDPSNRPSFSSIVSALENEIAVTRVSLPTPLLDPVVTNVPPLSPSRDQYIISDLKTRLRSFMLRKSTRYLAFHNDSEHSIGRDKEVTPLRCLDSARRDRGYLLSSKEVESLDEQEIEETLN